tara:strand:- start:447 stop:638 length:192 start_codon:yes stop_codon:yes gene_type:complete
MNKMEETYYSKCPVKNDCSSPGVSNCSEQANMSGSFLDCQKFSDKMQDRIKLFGSNIIGAKSQ